MKRAASVTSTVVLKLIVATKKEQRAVGAVKDKGDSDIRHEGGQAAIDPILSETGSSTTRLSRGRACAGKTENW